MRRTAEWLLSRPSLRRRLAEGVGFEPTVTRRPQRFSRPPHSSALATFHSEPYRRLLSRPVSTGPRSTNAADRTCEVATNRQRQALVRGSLTNVNNVVEGFGDVTDTDSMQAAGTWSVSELAHAVSDTIESAFGGEVWVRGEIIGYSAAASGHAYFSLIEPGTRSDRQSARMHVALFKTNRRKVNRELADAGGLKLEDGIEVRIRARVRFYAARGQVQLIMSGVDPHFTLGALAAERERTLADLAASGLLGRNASIGLAPVPLRVGLVTAAGSAAHADFVHELKSSDYAFELTLRDARVQGITAETDLIAALRTLGRAELDVIAVVRGGGERSDLLAFDLASVATAVARCPVPVICGIGHETDLSVTDRVAHTSAKTPTACAALLVSRVAEFDERLSVVGREIDRAARTRTATAAARLDSASGRLSLLAERRLRGPREQLSKARLRLAHRTDQHITAASARLRSATAVMAALAPQRTLERGFSITRTADGSIVRGAPSIGDTVMTETASARFASTVSDTTTPADWSDRDSMQLFDPLRLTHDEPGDP